MAFSPDEIFRQLETSAEVMATAMAQSEYMEDMRKVVWSQLRNEHAKEHLKLSVGALDALAYSDERYIRHLEGKKSARQAALRTQAHYRDLKDLGQYRQTQAVTERQLTLN